MYLCESEDRRQLSEGLKQQVQIFRFNFVETATTLKSFQTDKFSVGRTLFPFWGKPQHSARPRISPVTPPVSIYLNYFIVICLIQTILLGISYGNCIEVFVPTIVIFVCSPNICRTKVSNLFLPWWPTLREKFIFWERTLHGYFVSLTKS